MKIGLFTDCYLPTKNGVTTAVVQSREELARRGHSSILFTVAAPPLPGDEPSIHTVPSLPFNRCLELRLGLIDQPAIDRIVARERPDLIHTHTEFSLGAAGRRAARRAGLPLVHTFHTLYPAYRHYLPLGRVLSERSIAGLLARALREYDRVVCPSEKARTYLHALLPDLHTTVIGNGVSVERFDARQLAPATRDHVRNALGVHGSGRMILFAGRLEPEKRVASLLAALGPVLAAHPDWRLVLVGPGSLGPQLMATAASAGIARQVHVTGPVDWGRMVEFYAAADAFATVSLSEIHPMTLIEAAFCGLPVVARRDEGVHGLVLDGVNGCLGETDEEVAILLACLLQDEAMRRSFAGNARAVARGFTVEAHVDRLEALYRQVIDQHRTRGATG